MHSWLYILAGSDDNKHHKENVQCARMMLSATQNRKGGLGIPEEEG